jgi:hypothetical protein
MLINKQQVLKQKIRLSDFYVYQVTIASINKELIEDPKTIEYLTSQNVREDIQLSYHQGVVQKTNYLFLQYNVIIRQGNQFYKINSITLNTVRTSSEIDHRNNLTTRGTLNSVFNDGDWYNFSITKSGVYKLDYNFLTKDLKVPSSSLKFSTMGIFGYGGGTLSERNNAPYIDDVPENAIQIVDNNNNDLLEDGDYILFYGSGPVGWYQDGVSFHHIPNYYTATQTFFFTPNKGNRKLISPYSMIGSPVKTLTTFNDFGVIDDDLLNPENSGRIWFGSKLNNYDNTKTFNAPLKFISAGSKVLVTVSYSSEIPSGTYSISLGNVSASKTIKPYINTDTFLLDNVSTSKDIRLSISGSNTSNFFIDYIEMNVVNNLNYVDSFMAFRTLEGYQTNNILSFTLNRSNLNVWNVTTSYAPKSVALNGTSFSFNNQSLQEFVAFEPIKCQTPKAIGKINNQNLHGKSRAKNFIITSKEWSSVANDLALFHKEELNVSTNVADIESIYNEFSSGNKDISAIRRYVKYFYDNNMLDTPGSLLLLGDASVDYKNILGNKGDIIPTYETLYPWDESLSYCTDDFYGLLDPSEGPINDTAKKGTVLDKLDISVGRLPVSNITEARAVVEKIKQYKSTDSYGDWRTVYTLVADDVDDYPDSNFFMQSEDVADTSKMVDYKVNLEKIYCDAFKQEKYAGGSRYPDVEKMIKDRMTFGAILITYIGHGGSNDWAQERILSANDIETYKNIKNLPFITTATCGFAPFDGVIPSSKTAGEKFVLQPDGGAIGMMTTTREVYITDQGRYMDEYIKQYFKGTANGNIRSFGEIAMDTKNNNQLSVNSQKIVLLGDPALSVNHPKYNVVTTDINNGNDTLKALQKVTIKGEIRNLSNQILSDFNGFCSVTIYDKRTLSKLRANDGNVLSKDSFKLQNNKIFKGNASVVNGQFSISFIVPKDINYALGKGRISYYAADINQKPYRDASGVDSSIIVGGSNDIAATDKKGPQVTLFMNDEKFGFGGTTNSDPVLLAKLFDSSGINTVGLGIGHDITATIDNDTKNESILNNYYQSDLNNFIRGTVKFPYYGLTEGKHTLKVKAWDVYNNPGEGYTEFIVAKSASIALEKVLNYPNPFTTNTWFEFEHNRPNEPLDVTINILTISGKVVKSINQRIVTEGFRASKLIQWNGLDDYGDKIGIGAYIYRVSIRDTKGESISKYQKLVILQ